MWSISTSAEAERDIDWPSYLEDLATLGVMRYRHTLVLNKRLCVLLKPFLSRVW